VEYLIKVTLIGLISGITGTSIGGLMAFFVKKVNRRFISTTLEFSAGLMTSVVCFKLIPEAFKYGGIILTLLGVFFGVLTILMVEEFVGRAEFMKTKNRNSGLLRAGIVMAVGIALHNFPEGFAVGAGFEASISVGMMITAVIVIHDIPEGVAMAVPMKAGGFTSKRAFLFTMLSGVPMGLGALLGALIGGISEKFIGACLGFAAGAMLYVVYGELMVESKKLYSGRLPSISNVFGIVCGIIVTTIN
jgi:ZIP family zinc transporter